VALTDEDRKTVVDLVKESLGSLLKSGEVEVDDEGEKDTPKPAAKRGATPARAAKAAEQDAIRDMVRQAVTDVSAEEKRTAEQAAKDARLEELEAREQQREKAPIQMRKVTQKLWAYDEDVS
jgi:hypothetical protein